MGRCCRQKHRRGWSMALPPNRARPGPMPLAKRRSHAPGGRQPTGRRPFPVDHETDSGGAGRRPSRTRVRLTCLRGRRAARRWPPGEHTNGEAAAGQEFSSCATPSACANEPGACGPYSGCSSRTFPCNRVLKVVSVFRPVVAEARIAGLVVVTSSPGQNWRRGGHSGSSWRTEIRTSPRLHILSSSPCRAG